MAELDHDVAAFWHASLNHGVKLCDRVATFEATRESVDRLSRSCPRDVVEHGFRTLVLNRTRRGGILAQGASLNRMGENGKGVASRWYPDTLTRRLQEIANYADRIGFCETDGNKLLDLLPSGGDAVVFVDPPYTAGRKRAGKRLYACHEMDHDGLFQRLADSGMDFLMTYNRAQEIEALIRKHGFHAVQVMMKNAHHARIPELVITSRKVFVE